MPSALEIKLDALVETHRVNPGAFRSEDVNDLRSLCLASDNLCETLTSVRGARLAMYEVMLQSGSKRDPPPTFRPYASASTDNHRAIAQDLLQILQEGTTYVLSSVDDEEGRDAEEGRGAEEATPQRRDDAMKEVEGFLYYFATKTGSPLDDHLTSILMRLSRLLVAQGNGAKVDAQKESPEGKRLGQQHLHGEILRRLRTLFCLLYHLHNKFFVSLHACCFAHSFEEVFRLLLQYHDPLLSTHFDHHQVTIGRYAFQWVRSLFITATTPPSSAGSGDQERSNNGTSSVVVEEIWDWLVLSEERVLLVFLSLVAVIEQREELLALTTPDALGRHLEGFTVRIPVTKGGFATASPTAAVVPLFSVLPKSMSVKDLVKKAKIAAKNSPMTALTTLSQLLFPDHEQLQRDPQEVRDHLLTFVALPVEATELVAAFAAPSEGHSTSSRQDHLRFVVLDCRSADSFQFARLPTALHCGDEIGFDAELLARLVRRFENAKGSHLCVMGTGRLLVEEVNLLKLIVLHLVQNGFPFVSTAVGGFKAIIPFIKAGKIEYIRGAPASQATARKAQQGDSMSQEVKRGCLPTVSDSAPQQKRHAPAAPQEVPKKEELLVKAEELGSKAAAWGWGVVKALSEKVDTLKGGKAPGNHAAPTAAATTTAAQPPALPVTVAPSAPERSPARAPDSVRPTNPQASTTPPRHIDPTAAAAPLPPHPADKAKHGVIFTLAEDDDDLELITVVPRPQVEPAVATSNKPLTPTVDKVPAEQSEEKSDVKPTHSLQPIHYTPSKPTRSSGAMDIEDELDSFLEASPTATRPSVVLPHASATSASRRSGASTSVSEKHPFDDIFV